MERLRMTSINFNHRHVQGLVISETNGDVTVGDIRNAIAHLPDDAEVHLGTCDCGNVLTLFGFKDRGGAISLKIGCKELD